MVKPTPVIDVELLRAAAGARPFVPFKLRLTNGRVLEIDRPDFVFVAPDARNRFVLAYPDGTFQIMDTRAVSALELQNGRP